MNLPPDDNKVDPEVAAPCLRKFTQAGGRRPPGGSDITTNPRGPVGTGPPPPGPPGLTSIGGTPGIPLKFCKCFPLPSGETTEDFDRCPVTPNNASPHGYKRIWIWEQKCLETDWEGKVDIGDGKTEDPFGGWAEWRWAKRQWLRRVPPNPCHGTDKLIEWGESDPNVGDCHDKKTGNCVDKCPPLWLYAICCVEDYEPIEEIEDTPIPPGSVDKSYKCTTTEFTCPEGQITISKGIRKVCEECVSTKTYPIGVCVDQNTCASMCVPKLTDPVCRDRGPIIVDRSAITGGSKNRPGGIFY